MGEERPRRRGRKKGRVRPKKAPAKRTRAKAQKPPVSEEELLPGLLEGDIPEQPPITEEEAVEEERPAVAVEAAIIAEAVKEAVRAPQAKPAKKRRQPTALATTLMAIPEFRQRVIQLVVRKLRQRPTNAFRPFYPE